MTTPRLKKVQPLANYQLAVEFADGVKGVFSLAPHLQGPLFGPLRDEERFAEVTLDAYGAPSWPNGADWAPDAIYAEITQGK